MTKQEMIEILDECVDQQKLAKLVGIKLLMPFLEDLKAKVESKQIDLLKFTDLENVAIAKFIQDEIDKVKAL